jgi:hypothetical protein
MIVQAKKNGKRNRQGAKSAKGLNAKKILVQLDLYRLDKKYFLASLASLRFNLGVDRHWVSNYPKWVMTYPF